METAILSHGTFAVFQLQNAIKEIFLSAMYFYVLSVFLNILNENIFNSQSNCAC